MYALEFKGINSFLIGMSRLLLSDGVLRITKGERCIELPEPVMFKITDPTARFITIKERKWNPVLPFAESLWLASGRNDLSFIQYYCKRLSNFSDDGYYLRGGYGPRLRNYDNIAYDYKFSQLISQIYSTAQRIDQFRYITSCFEKDKFTRQAVINIGDPTKDCFDENNNLKISKDIPCTRHIQFMTSAKENKLNLTVYMRSNDFIWGASGVNIFNYMFMQEYFAAILKMDVGEYYCFVNNFHYYEERHKKLIEKLAEIDSIEDNGFCYNKSFNSLHSFDTKIYDLSKWENDLRMGLITEEPHFEDDFFDDWAKVFYKHRNKSSRINFINPILNEIMQ